MLYPEMLTLAPDGEGVAAGVAITAAAADSLAPLGLYLHVPFCATRCGYCDFNTYTPGELGSSASPESWHEAIVAEMDRAAEIVGTHRPVQTIFVGGGTPSLLGADGLGRLLAEVRARFTLADGAEVTTESNPESTSPEFFDGLLRAGYTRVSLGMQSAAPHVLATLDRTHSPGRAAAAAHEARAAGFDHVNLDLIYGTPGETDADLAATLDAVLDVGVDHVSAYALIVEDGTALARKVRRGTLPAPDDDVLADRYRMLDSRLQQAGFDWYEVSNWATTDAAQCRHNLGYWAGDDWWGLGPGAHSHVGGVRWWNRKHPGTYAQSLAAGSLPVDGWEALGAQERHTEEVMLAARCRTGLRGTALSPAESSVARRLVGDGLLASVGDAFVLTDTGRLLADGVVRDILLADER